MPDISNCRVEKKEFRVVHLSTSTSGGAGIAANRLSSALTRFKIDSTIMTLDESVHQVNSGIIQISRTLNSLILGRIATLLNARLSRMSFFSLFNQPAGNLLEALREFPPEATILHIHNWFNLTDFSELDILLKLGYKMVFTLHDERIFTGGCHYTFECESFTNSCSSCPRVPEILEAKVLSNQNQSAAFIQENIKELMFICPSNWMKSEALRSRALKNSNIVVIPNVFETSPRIQSYEPCNVGSLVHIGVASVDPWHYSKGGDILEELIRFAQNNSMNLCFHFLSEYSGNNKMDRFWSDIDVLFVPSRADNSPNVIHESKEYGVPVLASNVGGIPELLERNIDSMFDISDFDYGSIIDEFIRLKTNLRTTPLKPQSESTSDKFQSVKKHIQVYENLVK